MSTYTTSKSKKRTIFVLADHELRHLAWRYGQANVQGFHKGSKNNSDNCFYPTLRPIFKTCWLYRTNGLSSLNAAALQLRILWACLRWDEMTTNTSNYSSCDIENVASLSKLDINNLKLKKFSYFLCDLPIESINNLGKIHTFVQISDEKILVKFLDFPTENSCALQQCSPAEGEKIINEKFNFF
jgi:hypothetical protein